MNPEETDEFKQFEDVLHRVTKAPKKEVGDLEKAEASKTADKPSDGTSEDSEA